MPYEPTAAYPTAVATAPADPWDHPSAQPPQPRPMLEDAFGHAVDRLDRLEHLLGSLNGVVMRAGHQLEPLLTDGTYGDPDYPVDPSTPTPEDRRSTIAKRVSALGDRADRLADATSNIERRVEAILDALEV